MVYCCNGLVLHSRIRCQASYPKCQVKKSRILFCILGTKNDASPSSSSPQQVAALKLQAAGQSNGEGEQGDAGKTASLAGQNDAAWEAKVAENRKAADEKLANIAARHNEMVEVR